MAFESFKFYKSFQATCPGSLMVMGEHAVLHGQPAIVTSINKYLTAELEVFHNDNVDHQVLIKTWLPDEIDYKSRLDELDITSPLEYVLAVVEFFKSELINHGFDYQFTIKSDINHTMGLGSSAAVTIAMIKTLMNFIEDVGEQTFTDKKILEIGREIITKIQGSGSGADLAASLYEGVLWYEMQGSQTEKIADFIPIVAVYCGYKLSTKTVIAKIAASSKVSNRANTYQKIFELIGILTAEAKEAILDNNWEMLGQLFNMHYGLQESLELSDAKISSLIYKLRSNKNILGAKISGSGLGDCVIGIVNGKENIKTIGLENVLHTDYQTNLMFITMSKQSAVAKIFKTLDIVESKALFDHKGIAFAPSNIALVKYWGKSNTELNIPNTDSLSISLGELGAVTEVTIRDPASKADVIYLNNQLVSANDDFFRRITDFLDLFRGSVVAKDTYYEVRTISTVPVAAGLASSACGFAALVLALNNYYNWQLDEKYLSILARLGSGSAARSLWQGFVYWQRGYESDGMDCYAYKISDPWPELTIGLLLISQSKKPISSREAMLRTVNSSLLYKTWPLQVKNDIELMTTAIKTKNIQLLGETAEHNALSMHATMLAAKPAICYSTEETIKAMHKIWQLRKDGIEVYFTQDAGPNLKLIFDTKYRSELLAVFPELILSIIHSP